MRFILFYFIFVHFLFFCFSFFLFFYFIYWTWIYIELASTTQKRILLSVWISRKITSSLRWCQIFISNLFWVLLLSFSFYFSYFFFLSLSIPMNKVLNQLCISFFSSLKTIDYYLSWIGTRLWASFRGFRAWSWTRWTWFSFFLKKIN